MSLSHDLDELVHNLPDDWTRAMVMIRYESALHPGRVGFPDHNSPAAQTIRPVLGGNCPLYVTRGHEQAMVAAMRGVETVGFKGQVTLREVSVAGPIKLQHWNRPESMHRVRPEEVPGGGYVLRAA